MQIYILIRLPGQVIYIIIYQLCVCGGGNEQVSKFCVT